MLVNIWPLMGMLACFYRLIIFDISGSNVTCERLVYVVLHIIIFEIEIIFAFHNSLHCEICSTLYDYPGKRDNINAPCCYRLSCRGQGSPIDILMEFGGHIGDPYGYPRLTASADHELFTFDNPSLPYPPSPIYLIP